jgi:hypothetical protein
MKKISTIIIGIIFSLTVLNAQDSPPQAFSYKATITKSNGAVVANKTISLRISILQGSTSGGAVYTEISHPTTNSNGQIDIVIGGSTGLPSIDWSSGPYFLKTEIDEKGGTNYLTMSAVQLLSVPYALYAGASGSTNGAVTITGDQTITGNKTFNNDLLVNGLNVGRGHSSISSNTSFGASALFSNTTGTGNTAIGSQALSKNESGHSNTAIGVSALEFNDGGFQNIAIGTKALYTNKTGGNNNIAVGDLSLFSNETGSLNTAIGPEALYKNKEGWQNSGSGWGALYNNESGNQNTAMGIHALYFNKTGFCNTAVGSFAGQNNSTGGQNVFLGFSAGYYETGSNKLFIDNQERADESDGRKKALIYGVFDNDPANQTLTINGKVNVSNNKIINVADPTSTQDVATKAYVDSKAGGGGATTHSIGEEYGGGIVYYVYDNGLHGLIASKEDAYYVPSGAWWYAGTYIKTMAIANGIGAGKANTLLIFIIQGEGSYSAKYAARACYQNFNEGDVTFGDWYLPSPYELNLLYLQKDVVGGLDNNIYWSSYENSVNNASALDFSDGSWHYVDKSVTNHVRPIRIF